MSVWGREGVARKPATRASPSSKTLHVLEIQDGLTVAARPPVTKDKYGLISHIYRAKAALRSAVDVMQ